MKHGGKKTKISPHPFLRPACSIIVLIMQPHRTHSKVCGIEVSKSFKILKILICRGCLCFVCVSSANNRLYRDPNVKPARDVNIVTFYAKEQKF